MAIENEQHCVLMARQHAMHTGRDIVLPMSVRPSVRPSTAGML